MALNTVVWILLGILALIVLYLIFTYNSLVNLRNRADNALSQIDIQLKRRFDLIPNLIETVKGYVKHEKETLKDVTAARTEFLKATSLAGKAKAENMLEQSLKSIFAVAESYPNLKANENFLQLQEELSGTENKIAYSRQFYNDTVQTLNTKLESFPSNIVGRTFNFVKKEFFEAEETEKGPVKVKF